MSNTSGRTPDRRPAAASDPSQWKESPHFKPLDLKNMEMEDPTQIDAPICFYRDKTTGERHVWIMGELVPVHEKPTDPILLEHWWDWDKVKEGVSLDGDTLEILASLANRYNTRQSFLLEGPPAVSKTFAIWVFASLVGLPYLRVPFAPDTKMSSIVGGNRPGQERKLYAGSIPDFLGKKYVRDQMARDTELAAVVNDIQERYQNNQDSTKPYSKITDDELMWVASRVQLNSPYEVVDNPWRESLTIYFYEHGGIIAFDEPNIVLDTSLHDGLQPLVEASTWRCPVTGRPQGDAIRHRDMCVFLAQNPMAVGNRKDLSQPIKSRGEYKVLSALTKEYIVHVLDFFMKGIEVDYLRTKHKRTTQYKGRKNVSTKFRQYFEKLPFVDDLILNLANFHMIMVGLVDAHQIGTLARNGGNYIFDQRDIAAFLNSMVSAMNHYRTERLPDGSLAAITDWEYVIREAIYGRYIEGLQEPDRQRVEAVLDQLPLWDAIRAAESGSKPGGLAGRVGQGIKVTDKGGGRVALRSESIYGGVGRATDGDIAPVQMEINDFTNHWDELDPTTIAYLKDRIQEGKIKIITAQSGERRAKGKILVEVNDVNVKLYLENTFAAVR
jgi:hypothetical protein